MSWVLSLCTWYSDALGFIMTDVVGRLTHWDSSKTLLALSLCSQKSDPLCLNHFECSWHFDTLGW